MRGRGRGRRGGRQGRGGRNNRGGRSKAPSSSNTTVGMTAAIKQYTLEYGTKNCADHNRNSWEKISTYCGGLLGPDIGIELATGQEKIIPKPEYTPEQKAKYAAKELKRVTQVKRLIAAKELQKAGLKEISEDKTTANKLNALAAAVQVATVIAAAAIKTV